MSRKDQPRKTRIPGLYQYSDGSWLIRAYGTETKTGRWRQIRKTLSSAHTEAQALEMLAKLKIEIAAGRNTQSLQRITVSDYAELWLEGKAKQGLRRKVLRHYTDVLGLHILPNLGVYYLNSLSRTEVLAWVAWIEKKIKASGELYSQDTFSGWWRVLCQLLRDACATYGLIDPTCRVLGPKSTVRGRREHRTMTQVELAAFLEVIQELAPHRYVEAFVLAYTGMRAGELYALTWEDVDLERGQIRIARSVSNKQVTPTKTGAPREVALTDSLVTLLRDHRRRLIEGQHIGLSSGLVFPSRVGSHRYPNSLEKVFKKAAAATEIAFRVTPQVLRRTFNTLMVQAGVDRIVLRSQMGHCSEEMTERYAGVSIESKREAVARLHQIL